MKQILIAFVAATVLLALEDALARQCRNLLWSGILPLAALLSSVGLLAAGALPLQAPCRCRRRMYCCARCSTARSGVFGLPAEESTAGLWRQKSARKVKNKYFQSLRCVL